MKTCIYAATVALDRNRWGSREPSFEVSRWLDRFKDDGFDGVELWEFHYLNAGADERKRLEDARSAIKIYNSYVGFSDTDAESREQAAQAIERLEPWAIKYNLGHDVEKIAEYRRNLLTWDERLPSSCKLLCECHQGSVLEDVETATSFFDDLDAERFGVIVHFSDAPDGLVPWFEAMGKRIQHVHVQMRAPDTDPRLPEARARLDAGADLLGQCGFDGPISLEFTRGIGRDEEIETIYTNMLVDLEYWRTRV